MAPAGTTPAAEGGRGAGEGWRGQLIAPNHNTMGFDLLALPPSDWRSIGWARELVWGRWFQWNRSSVTVS